ncbi:hypothetical protein ACF0H5_005231 [Mactra antiquata]
MFEQVYEYTWKLACILALCLMVLPEVSVQQTTPSPQYCQHFSTSTTGPPLPDLPDQYQTIIEANIVDKNMTVTGYEYFDSIGNRATLQMRQNGTLFTNIYDYANTQLFYVSNNSCRTDNLTVDNNNILFGNVTEPDGSYHVFTSGGALHFAKHFGEKYMGNTTVRGIHCDWWRSCLYWPQLRSNFTLDYYFTASDWSAPIQGSPIPVRAVATGLQAKDFELRPFKHYYDYIDFRTVIADPTVFETPKGVVCSRKDTKPVPKLPKFYHYRQEIIQDASNKIFQADVWYDKEYRYIRYDYRTASPAPPLNTENPITEIHDFNYGIRYTQDQVTGRCISSSISNSSFDVGENTTIYYVNGTKGYVVHMKDPMQLFYLDSSYAYTGQRYARGLQCNVFTSRRKDYPVPGQGRMTAIFEYYFLADGFQEEPDDGSTSPQNVPVYLEVTIPDLSYHVIYNFVDFDEEHPETSIFDVSSCYSESSKLQFTVRFPGSYRSGTSGQIIENAGRWFRDTMQVNPIRVQDVRLDYDNSQIYISATLIDRSPYLAQFTFLSGKEIQPQDDKVYQSPDANDVGNCSKLCVTYTGFVCNSFDFCPQDSNGACRLSKQHIGDGDAVVINSTCNHFSRTVNGPSKVEPSIQDAFAKLKTAVYDGNLQFEVFVNGLDNPLKYTAVDISVSFGWLNSKKVPTLTGQFSYHEEITIPEIDAVFNTHVYYDSDFQLVRYDMVNTQPSPPLFNTDPISTIHDYSSGLAYTLDKTEGNCTIAPIGNTSFDAGSTKNAGYVLKMKSPLDLFYLNGTYRYAGQRTIRGILCDVFEDTRTDFRYGRNPLNSPAVFQFYFMSDDWQEMSEDDGSPVRTQPIALIVSSAKGQYTLTYNFYDFSEQQPDLSNFDIRPCYTGSQIRHFLIKFAGQYHPMLDTNLKQFTKSVQQQLAFETSSSFLRFQDPQITYTDDGYVYYLATMVEQAPYLLDFTKTSNNVAFYAADKTINNVKTDTDCATLCRNETTFNCESFDFCPSINKCQLSKKHGAQSGSGTQPSQICDHYSKTVDVVAPIEPSVSTAFIVIKNIIFTRGFNISVYDDTTGKTGVYHAVLFDEDILRPDSQATTSVNLNHFIPSRGHVMIANPELTIKGLSVDQCASKCLTESTMDCQSFDYCFDTGSCTLSHIHVDQNLTVRTTHLLCDLYSRTYLDSYTAYPGVSVQTKGDATVSNTYSADFCAQKCSTYQQFQCKSFDFCANSNTCILKRSHILELSKAAVQSNGGCSHYSRNYIHDFDVTRSRNFVAKANSLVVSNVSSTNLCAKLCVENSGMNCQGFVFCQSSATCTIIGVSPSKNRNSISNNKTCDLYTRKYFPDGTPYGAPGKSAPSSSSSGYSGGAMAGLAVGMLIPGMVIGAALLYFMRTKRLVEEEQLRMGFVNMPHDNEDDKDWVKPSDEHEPSHAHQYDTVNC